MAMGKPAVGTDIGGIRDIILNGATGYLVPPGDPAALAEKVIYLLKNSDLRAEMGKKARITAEKRFPMPVWVDRIMEIYGGLKSRRRKAA
jgi:glycosyltransferase involved in cell wall biosynthesis